MLSPSISKLVRDASIKDTKENSGGDQVSFEINRVISKTATYYEKVRYSVDYKEEHTIRRSAIERILKRKLLIERQESIGISLLSELVSGQYISENRINESASKAIDEIVDKYILLINNSPKQDEIKGKILSLTASDIDYYLDSYAYEIDIAVVQAFYERTKEYIKAKEQIESAEMDMILYSACLRSLLSCDDEMILYALWRKFVPEWKNMGPENIKELATKSREIISKINSYVKNPKQWQIAGKLKNETVCFLVIRELVKQYGAESEIILNDSEKLDAYIRNFMQRIYKKENEKIKLRGIRAVIYLLLTKVILAIIIEVPYEMTVMGSIQTWPLAINIIFPPALLFLLTRRIKSLGTKNTEAVVKNVRSIVYGEKAKTYVIKTTPSKNITVMFLIIYTIFVAAIFGIIISILNTLDFNMVSTTLFLFFLALVSYFAFRVRHNAKRWQVVDNDSFIPMLGNILALPVINTGRWLSTKFASINILVLILDFVVETPFKFALNFSNEFITYLRDKTEEIR